MVSRQNSKGELWKESVPWLWSWGWSPHCGTPQARSLSCMCWVSSATSSSHAAVSVPDTWEERVALCHPRRKKRSQLLGFPHHSCVVAFLEWEDAYKHSLFYNPKEGKTTFEAICKNITFGDYFFKWFKNTLVEKQRKKPSFKTLL